MSLRNSSRTSADDRDGNSTQDQYDQRSRLTKETDALGQTTTMAYDGNNNVLKSTLFRYLKLLEQPVPLSVRDLSTEIDIWREDQVEDSSRRRGSFQEDRSRNGSA